MHRCLRFTLQSHTRSASAPFPDQHEAVQQSAKIQKGQDTCRNPGEAEFLSLLALKHNRFMVQLESSSKKSYIVILRPGSINSDLELLSFLISICLIHNLQPFTFLHLLCTSYTHAIKSNHFIFIRKRFLNILCNFNLDVTCL